MQLHLPPLPPELQPLEKPKFLAKGTGNSHWLLITRKGELIWRQFGQAPGCNHEREAKILQLLQNRSWVPWLIRSLPSRGLLFYKTPGDHPQAEKLRPSTRQALLEILVDLWQQPCDLPGINYEDLVFSYWQETGYAAPLQPLVEQLRTLANRWPEQQQLTHHDLHPGNLLLNDQHWTLLDWEYAAPGNPWIDAVALDRWLNLSDTEKEHLIRALPDLGLDNPWQAMTNWLEGLDQLWQAARTRQQE
ncbi:Phosphotransferase enzyme family protein [Marinospirillum celere]|uniref:Phosphotransferase enzyme family protein n=1 Tax=Marinospirillum celere TaxID=1122252 RepID=A0A1I1DYP8_9GAMM|nr:phosphotransferase [Marinospirillum celere]SFB77723.1 Phosphotransferase enzyme family protein [Marinospirillum celere]